MRKREDPPKTNKRPGQKCSKPVNYQESPPSKELNDSDFELTSKQEKPLDNKRFPSSTHIAIQKNIELNKMIANQHTSSEPSLLDAMDINNSEMPVATSSPRSKTSFNPLIPDTTTTPEENSHNLLPEATIDPLDVASGNKNNTAPVAPINTENAESLEDTNVDKKEAENSDLQVEESSTSTAAKPKRGKFHNKIIGIRRQKDPRASCCNKCTMTLSEM